MDRLKIKLILSLLFIVIIKAQAQNSTEHSAWFLWANSLKVAGNWGIHLDLQARSADDVQYLRQVLVRPGVTYHFNRNQNLTFGYALIETFRRIEGAADNNLTEHRIWQQFIQNHRIKRSFLTHRFRTEQRFIERSGDDELFAQRFRYFGRVLLPFRKYEHAFSKGPYVALQNEVFFNIQSKDELNNSIFDQNRAYFGLGVRVSPKIDVEIGYLNHFVKGIANNSTNNVGQLGITSRL